MSAYIVDKAHIDALVTLAEQGPTGIRPGMWRSPSFRDHSRYEGQQEILDRIGAMLIQQNVRSIEAKYPNTVGSDKKPGPIHPYWTETYTHRDGRRLTVPESLMACHGWEYQSCETRDWKTTEAFEFIGDLRRNLERCVHGYEASETWSITDRKGSQMTAQEAAR